MNSTLRAARQRAETSIRDLARTAAERIAGDVKRAGGGRAMADGMIAELVGQVRSELPQHNILHADALRLEALAISALHSELVRLKVDHTPPDLERS